MARSWLTALEDKGDVWHVPPEEETALNSLIENAGYALNSAKAANRTAESTAACQTAFEALTAKMRFLKTHYFLKPPLTDADFASLGLKTGDTKPTPIPRPVNQPGIKIIRWGPHSFGFELFLAADMGGGDTERGIRVYYGLSETGAPVTGKKPLAQHLAGGAYLLSGPPLTANDLPNSFFTRRKKDLIDLPPEASGKICHMAARYENSKGEAGPFGTMIQAIVP
jgi:hypothetical protein